MSKSVKIFALISLSIFLVFYAYKLSYYYAEKYYFDKLFYRKSQKHGYLKSNSEDLTQIQNREIRKRIEDVISLVEAHNNSAQVLGVQSNQEYKIAIIGDSFVYGGGIKRDERFSEILESKLDNFQPTTVYNLSLNGDNIIEHLAKYKLAESHLNPDLYIIGIVNNDFMVDRIDRYPDQEKWFNEMKSRCPKEVFIYNWEGYEEMTWEEVFLKGYYPSGLDSYSNTCLLIEALSEMDKSKIIFFPITPMLEESSILLPDTYQNINQEVRLKDQWLMLKYINAITMQDGYFLYYDYSNVPEDMMRVSEKEGHYSKYVNKQIAEKLYEEITSNQKWNFINN